MNGETVLAIDVGTQSVRALAFTPRGELVDAARVVYSTPYHMPRPGWAEQDPGYYWQRLTEACRKLWSQGLVAPESLAALALTTHRATVVNLDDRGDPLRPAIVWLDQRRASQLPSLGMAWRLAFRLTGLAGTLKYLQAETEANWLRQHQPSLWEKTAHYLFLSGYLTYRLTGCFVDSVACQVGYIPFDYRRQTWPRPSHWKWRAIPVRPEVFPDLVLPGEQLGEITAEAAAATGLPRGLPVIAAASDKACEVLGAGCLEPHQGCIGYGTSATINVNSARYVEPIPLIPPYPSACPGEYNLEVQVYRGFWMVSWFKEEFAWREQSLSRQSGVPVEELLDRLASEVPPGSLGLVLQPFWSPGLRYPGPEARGAVIGFSGAHTRAHLYRALLEGLAYGLREGRERIEKRSKVPIREIVVCGGGSRSEQVMQIIADVFGLPAVRPSIFEASGLGAAMLAAVGAKLQPDLSSAVREMTGRGRVYEPRPEAVRVYDELYRRVFLRMYPKLSSLYSSIKDITLRAF